GTREREADGLWRVRTSVPRPGESLDEGRETPFQIVGVRRARERRGDGAPGAHRHESKAGAASVERHDGARIVDESGRLSRRIAEASGVWRTFVLVAAFLHRSAGIASGSVRDPSS